MTVQNINKRLMPEANMTPAADKQQAATSAADAFTAALQRATLHFGGGNVPAANQALADRFNKPANEPKAEPARQTEKPDARPADKSRHQNARADKAAPKPRQEAPAETRPQADGASSAGETVVEKPAETASDTSATDQGAADQSGQVVAEAPQQTTDTAAVTVQAQPETMETQLAQTLTAATGAETVETDDTLMAGADQDPFAWLEKNHGDDIANLQGQIDAGEAGDEAGTGFDALMQTAAASTAAKSGKAQTGADQGEAQAAASDQAQSQAENLAEMLAGTTGRVEVKVQTTTAAEAPSQTAGAVLEALAALDMAAEGADLDAQGQNAQTGQNGTGQNGQSGQGITVSTQQTAANGGLDNAAAARATDVKAFAAAVAAQVDGHGDTGGSTHAEPQGVASLSGPSGPEGAQKTAAAQAAQAPRAPRTILEQHVIDQVSVQIEKQVKEGADTVKIQLRPHELGKIEIKLEVGTDGRVTASVTADRPETLSMLQKDVKGLERALEDAGLKPDASSTSFNLRGEQQQNAEGNANQGRRSRQSRGLALDGEAAAGAAAITSQGQRSGGGRAGVDISV